jgi:hypothetical protein
MFGTGQSLPFGGFSSCRNLCDRAIIDTRTAARAEIQIDAAGAFAYLDLEIPRSTFDLF